jgi:hypothetical protein
MVEPVGLQDDNMIHALCILDIYGYNQTLRTWHATLIAFPLQQWRIERASVSSYAFTSWLVIIFFPSIIFTSDLPTKVFYVFLTFSCVLSVFLPYIAWFCILLGSGEEWNCEVLHNFCPPPPPRRYRLSFTYVNSFEQDMEIWPSIIRLFCNSKCFGFLCIYTCVLNVTKSEWGNNTST